MLGKREKPDNDLVDDEIYYFKDGLRFVKEYTHEFSCYAKRRWLGCLLIDVYSSEFKAFSAEYYKQAIEYWKED